jgi:hypothetical protein
MWLPTPIYERTPLLWLLMAILFVVLALYIGFAYKLTIFYLLRRARPPHSLHAPELQAQISRGSRI